MGCALLPSDLDKGGRDTKPLCTLCEGLDNAPRPLLTMLCGPSALCLGSEPGLLPTVPLQPSCAPATPFTRHVWQPASPPRRARMGCWARWTQSSARCWARAVSAPRAPSCTGATQRSASPRRSVVGPFPARVGPSKADLTPGAPHPTCHPWPRPICPPPGLLWGWSVSQGGSSLGWSGSSHHLSPLCPTLSPTAACTDSAGVPRALGETWNSSLRGCCRHRCQAPNTIVPVDSGCPGPRPETCPRFGEVALLLPTEDPCCLGTVCGKSHHSLPSTAPLKMVKGRRLPLQTLMDRTRLGKMKGAWGGCGKQGEPHLGERSPPHEAA